MPQTVKTQGSGAATKLLVSARLTGGVTFQVECLDLVGVQLSKIEIEEPLYTELQTYVMSNECASAAATRAVDILCDISALREDLRNDVLKTLITGYKECTSFNTAAYCLKKVAAMMERYPSLATDALYKDVSSFQKTENGDTKLSEPWASEFEKVKDGFRQAFRSAAVKMFEQNVSAPMPEAPSTIETFFNRD